jgi:2-dehydro-3-deoxygluconokinase
MERSSAGRNAIRPVGTADDYDVLLIGELLVELSAPTPLRDARRFDLSFSGDTLNAAAAAAAAGARVGVIATVGDDELGEAMLAHLKERDVDTSLIRLVDRPNGVYLLGADPDGAREFVYLRRGSAGSLVQPSDVETDAVRSARALVVSGIACAISDSAAAAVDHAATIMSRQGRLVIYDPNFRRKLMSPQAAREAFSRLAPLSTIVKPSWPNDTGALFDSASPEEAAAATRRAGASAALVTLGKQGALLDDGRSAVRFPPVPAPATVDATGSGDTLAGTLAARLALGDELTVALRIAMTAAALSLSGQGGTGRVASLAEIQAHLQQTDPYQASSGSEHSAHMPSTNGGQDQEANLQ